MYKEKNIDFDFEYLEINESFFDVEKNKELFKNPCIYFVYYYNYNISK